MHVFAAGHGMEVDDFLKSAAAAAGPLTQGATVGEKIFGAIEATWAAVGQNTNLGIVLLCAPLAQAALAEGEGDLRARLTRVSRRPHGRRRADLAFRAIARARPAGLGDAPEHDVRGPAAITLLGAMQAAADRDRVAFNMRAILPTFFDRGLPILAAARGLDPRLAALKLYAEILGAVPDSHIARKFGIGTALATMAEASVFAARPEALAESRRGLRARARIRRSAETARPQPRHHRRPDRRDAFCGLSRPHLGKRRQKWLSSRRAGRRSGRPAGACPRPHGRTAQ